MQCRQSGCSCPGSVIGPQNLSEHGGKNGGLDSHGINAITRMEDLAISQCGKVAGLLVEFIALIKLKTEYRIMSKTTEEKQDEQQALATLFEVKTFLGARKYKQAIRTAWFNGNYAGECLEKWAGALQHIRNVYGPSWLSRACPKAPVFSVIVAIPGADGTHTETFSDLASAIAYHNEAQTLGHSSTLIEPKATPGNFVQSAPVQALVKDWRTFWGNLD